MLDRIQGVIGEEAIQNIGNDLEMRYWTCEVIIM